MSAAHPTPLQDDRYLVVERLGSGGMGSVLRAFDRADQRLVALKTAHEHAPAGPAHPLAAEFDVSSRLDHPHIVRAHGLGCARSGPLARGATYLVLEHVDGDPSHRALPPDRLDASRTTTLAVQLLDALSRLHREGFVHRDLKPSNVLIDRAGEPLHAKLIDFGMAVPVGTRGRPGRISGSLPYVSPEALLGSPLDGRADLYGLGLLLYRLLTGVGAAPPGEPARMLRWHLDGPPVDVTCLRPEIDGRLARFVRRLTERDPARRPACAAEALLLLGRTPSDAAAARPRGDRAERAALRLAIDAVRLGARRRHRLPGCPVRAAGLVRDAGVWAQVRGVGFHSIGPDGPGPARAAIRLLTEHGPEAPGLFRRLSLDTVLPLRLLGGTPILDVARVRDHPSATDIAKRLSTLVRVCARRRPLVIHTARGFLNAPTDADRPSGSGGLLVLEEPAQDAGPRSDRSSSTDGCFARLPALSCVRSL